MKVEKKLLLLSLIIIIIWPPEGYVLRETGRQVRLPVWLERKGTGPVLRTVTLPSGQGLAVHEQPPARHRRGAHTDSRRRAARLAGRLLSGGTPGARRDERPQPAPRRRPPGRADPGALLTRGRGVVTQGGAARSGYFGKSL